MALLDIKLDFMSSVWQNKFHFLHNKRGTQCKNQQFRATQILREINIRYLF